MTLELLPQTFTVCQLPEGYTPDLSRPFCFFARTDEEASLVCESAACPDNALKRQDGWLCLRIAGPLDFSLIGVLSSVAGCLAENRVPIFAVSTYNTDYVLFQKDHRETALNALRAAGHVIKSFI